MTKLDALRGEIDEVTDEIVRLLNRRLAIALAIGREKRDLGLPLFDPAREAEQLARLAAGNPGPLTDSDLERIFRQILTTTLSAMEREAGG